MPDCINTEGEGSLEGEETSQKSVYFCNVRSSSSGLCLEANAKNAIKYLDSRQQSCDFGKTLAQTRCLSFSARRARYTKF